MRNLVEVAVIGGAFVVPGGEHRLDRGAHLLQWIVGERLAALLQDDVFEFFDQLLELLRLELGVGLDPGLLLGNLQPLLELLGLDTEHDLAEHLDEAPVGVQREAPVAGQFGQPLERVRIEAEVEDGVHHAGHREFGARADGDQQRIYDITKLLAGLLLDMMEGLDRLFPHAVGKPLARGVVGIAGLRGDGEPGRHGQPGVGHFGNAGALAPQQITHVLVPLFKEVHPLSFGYRLRTRGFNRCQGHGILLSAAGRYT